MADNKTMQISHETIYKSLYVQARGVLKKELMNQLRYGHKMRHTKMHSTRGDRGTIRIVNGLSISDRPPEAPQWMQMPSGAITVIWIRQSKP